MQTDARILKADDPSDKSSFVAALDELIAEELSAVGGGMQDTIQNQPRAQPMKRRQQPRGCSTAKAFVLGKLLRNHCYDRVQ